MPRRPVLLCSAALLSLALAGCSGGDEGEDPSAGSSSPSASETTASASPSESATPGQDSSPEAPAETSAPADAPAAAEPVEQPTPAEPELPAAEDASGMSADAQAFFAAGGACDSDTFPTGTPSPELMAELQSICAAQAGDQPGYAGPGSIDNYPIDPGTAEQPGHPQQDGDGTMDADGYQRPEPDADGYVGPSDEYYGYDGYVEPGFEYQVGSECFDADLGRCKTSGEIQTEYMEGAEVEELMQERGMPLPSEQ